MISDKKTKYDGTLSFIGGQDSSILPHLLTDDQSAELWNCTVRGASLKPRPGFDQIPLSFPTDEIESWFKNQQHQGSLIFQTQQGKTLQVWSVGGRFFSVDLDRGGIVSEITPELSVDVSIAFTVPAVGSTVAITVTSADLVRVGYPIKIGGMIYNVISKSGDTLTAENVDDVQANVIPIGTKAIYLDVNSKNLGICYMEQAEDFVIAQDGFSKAFIFDGGSSRRSDPTKGEVPTGTVMAYGIGRLWVAIGGNRFVASDIVYGPSGTDAYGRRDAILKFTENEFLSGGGAFTAQGLITAMSFIPSLDTSTGQGPLMVFSDTAISSVNAPADRESWSTVTNPIQSISLLANGATSFYGTIPTINGDIFYRALDGLRSFYISRREFGSWGNTPISGELGRSIEGDAEDLLQFESAIVFEKRLIFTLNSRPTNHGAYWKGMGVLDFDPLTNMKGKSPPVYDGVWTGVDPIWLFSGKYGKKDRAFMSVRNSAGENELWEFSKDHQFDNGDGRIQWTMISRGFGFQNPMEMLRLWNLELFPSNVIGNLDITASYRPDNYPCWFNWTSQPVCANWRRCTSWGNCVTPTAFRGGYKTRIPFGQPLDVDETSDGKPARLGYTHQLKLQFEGYGEIMKLRIAARELDEEPAPRVDQPEGCQEINCCPDDFYAWRTASATDAGGESS